MATTVMQTNFTGGIWTPLLEGRIDIDKYKNALHLGTNGFVLPHGGFRMRGGSKYLGSVKDATRKARLVPFIYNRVTAYVLEFGDGYIRFWRADGTRVEVTGVPVEVQTPYSDEDLLLVQKKQSWDVVYFTHPNYPVQKLTRLSDTSWTFSPVDWQDGPYLKENLEQVKSLQPSGTTGAITLTAENAESETTFGTWNDTLNSVINPFASGNVYARLRFTAPASISKLKRVRIYVSAVPLSPVVITLNARIYETSGGNPTTLIDNSTNSQYAGGYGQGGAGIKEFVFNPVSLVAGTVYVVEIQASVANSTVAFHAVNDNASFASDRSTTPTATFSALATDYRCELTYTVAGNFTIFQSGHVGALMRLRHPGYTQKTTISAENVWTTPQVIYGKFTVDLTPNTAAPWAGRIVMQKSFDNGTNWYDVASFFYSTSQEFVETKTGILYRLGCKTGDRHMGICYVTLTQDELWGVVKITEVLSVYQARATVIQPLGGTTPTAMWAEGAWSDARGYPATITAHEDRFYYAGTSHQPTTIWASWVGDYETMMPSDTAESALNVTFVRLDGPIQWIDSFTAFLMGTIQEEAWVKGSQNKPITSDNIDSKVQGAVGSCQGVRPVRIESSIFHLQLQRRQIREIAYSFESDGYVSADRTNWARHLFDVGVVDLAYQRDPHQLLWAWRTDGKAAVLTYYAAEKVLAWSLVETDGEIESMTVIPGGMGLTVGEDNVWMVVKRTVDGQTKKYLEVLQNNTLVTVRSDYFCVDCGITYSGTSTATITGLSHLEGKSVAILADGAAHPARTVSGGQITLQTPASKVQVGLPYKLKLMPLRIEVGSQTGVSQTRIKRFVDVTFRLFETIDHDAGPLYGKNDEDTSLWPLVLPDSDRARKDKMVDVRVPWPEGWEEEGQIYVEHSSPGPLTIGSLIYSVEMH
jgi:hypothetical protein